ncbi:metalloprotease [Entomophthora muscae]|uniref:Metalloprotease n=1 Tax=Entomophthora muscae TaxID=34485 RepID=A0ACC2SS51_9FUNG|nr:metalloprotease [Entomophthora muscae]
MLVMGNFDQTTATRIFDATTLIPKSVTHEELPKIQVPRGDFVMQVLLPNEHQLNSAIAVYLETYNTLDYTALTISKLLEWMLDNFAFNYLRKEKNLGYHVDAKTLDFGTHGGIVIRVQSHLAPVLLEPHIETMLKYFITHVCAMPPNDLQTQINSYLTSLTRRRKDFLHHVAYYWDAILTRRYDFNKGNLKKQLTLTSR